MDPLPFRVWGKIPSVVEETGGTVTQNDSNFIAAEFPSSLFKLTNDEEFRRSDDAVHVRSAARAGYSDTGGNRDRVAVLRERLLND